MLFRTHTQKAAERHHGVSNTAADLFDHEPIDAPDVVPRRVIDRRAFDSVTLDEGLTCHRC